MSNRLPVLAEEIRRDHLATEAATKTMAERALGAGAKLIEAKALVKHGEWLPFLKEAGIPERTAQRYMTLAEGRLNSDTVSDLGGISAALRFLRIRKIAHEHLCEAERACREGRTGDDEIVPLEVAIEAMNEMIGMFPPYERGRP